MRPIRGMEDLDPAHPIWKFLLVASVLTLQAGTAVHALLNKRESRAAMMWTAFIVMSPLVGAGAYWILGVNRIKRRATKLRGTHEPLHLAPRDLPVATDGLATGRFPDLDRLVTRVVNSPLLGGNAFKVLNNGDEAFPEMLAAIDAAQTSVTLSTYIFDYDAAGRRFVDALDRARRRGVDIRVLIDDVGAHYSRRSVARKLRGRGVRCAHFLPHAPLRRLFAINLRSHRKILVIDGRVGFTGGMNIRHGNCLLESPRSPIRDTHFRMEGPVVTQLQEVFADDWKFSTNERLSGETWFPRVEAVGPLAARAIPDGPDEDFEKLPWTILGAIGCARESILIVTPYFLPEREMITALNVAALRGVRVDIVLPARCNLPFLLQASRASWSLLLERGCRIRLTPPPFDHSKIMVVDQSWSLIGSANMDPRSLRLNFELNVEVYGGDLANELSERVETKLADAHDVTLGELSRQSVPSRLIDNVARLFTPYL